MNVAPGQRQPHIKNTQNVKITYERRSDVITQHRR